MVSIPVVVHPEPRGIVIRSGAPRPKPVRFLAYLWAEEETTAEPAGGEPTSLATGSPAAGA